MRIIPTFLRSLLLTSIVSFAAPFLLIGGTLATFFILSYIPLLAEIGQAIGNQIVNFLAIFGAGCPLEGILVISFTCSIVGSLFDVYAFYSYQSLRGGEIKLL